MRRTVRQPSFLLRMSMRTRGKKTNVIFSVISSLLMNPTGTFSGLIRECLHMRYISFCEKRKLSLAELYHVSHVRRKVDNFPDASMQSI